MAKNTTPYFHKGGAQDTTLLTTSFADIITGQADDSDVTEITVVNVTASNVNIIIADETDRILLQYNVPANAGTSARAVRILQDNELPGTQLDAFGNYYYRLLNGKKLRMRAGDANALYVRWKRMDF